MKKILVKGPALTQSGYGEHARFILRSLRSRPDLFEVYFLNIRWGETSWLWEDTEEREWLDFILQKTLSFVNNGGTFDISLQVTIPNEWERLAPVNIGVTAGIESTKIVPQWIEKSMMMDKIIVVSQHAKYGFDNTECGAVNNQTGEEIVAKVMCPIEVVGYPIKEIEAADIVLNLTTDFNFLTVGTWIPRKNLENTIKWFVEEFYEQSVGLIVKTSLAKNSIRDRIYTQQRLNTLLSPYDDRQCQVYLLHGDLSEQEMSGLYTHPKVKAFVSLSHGEGFGLPLFEAAYSALPIIAPDWGGQCDFLHTPQKSKKGTTKLKPMFSAVSYDLALIQKEAHWDGVVEPNSQWCFPIEWHYKKCLRDMKKNHVAYKSRAKKLMKWIVESYPEEVQYQKLCDVVYKPSQEEEEWNSVLNEIQLV
tara:strand:- start:4916 stop:6172 length:1257 start_codon:yes stop_codon:yes gene_type:complete